jgi:putative PIN family toxin of toxin-antitoxin system
MNRIVCDTNVIISGFFWRGAPRQILSRVEAGQDMLFTSRDLLVELERVLSYKKLDKILSETRITSADILRWVISQATIIIPKPLSYITVKEDPSDDMILACALTAGVDTIISGDKHLLRLGAYESLKIIKAADYIHEFIEGNTGSAD